MFAILENGNLTNPAAQTWNFGITLDPSITKFEHVINHRVLLVTHFPQIFSLLSIY